MRTLILLLTMALASSVVFINTAEAQTETDARRMFEEGNTHLQRALRLRGQARNRGFREALNLYHRSLRVTRARSVLFNIALCYEHLERYQDAYAYFSEYLAIPDLSEQDRREAEHRLSSLRPNVALVEIASTPPGGTIYVDRRDLSPRGVTPATIATQPGNHRIIVVLEGHDPGEAPVEAVLGETLEMAVSLNARPATVHVETDPPGAEVRFDTESGETRGITPLTATLAAGQHRVYVTLGDRSGRETFEAPPGGEVTVEVRLAAATTPGSVSIAVDVPRALVIVDGIEIGQAPIDDLRLTPGIHRVSVLGGDQYQGWSDTVEIGPGHELDLDVHLASSTPSRRFGVWPSVGMAVAVALGVAAAATGGWALSLSADFDNIYDTCQANDQACDLGTVYRTEAFALERRIRGFAIATDVLIGTAAALGIASLALMLLNREVDDSSSVEIAMTPTEGGAFASIRVRGMLRLAP